MWKSAFTSRRGETASDTIFSSVSVVTENFAKVWFFGKIHIKYSVGSLNTPHPSGLTPLSGRIVKKGLPNVMQLSNTFEPYTFTNVSFDGTSGKSLVLVALMV